MIALMITIKIRMAIITTVALRNCWPYKGSRNWRTYVSKFEDQYTCHLHLKAHRLIHLHFNGWRTYILQKISKVGVPKVHLTGWRANILQINVFTFQWRIYI